MGTILASAILSDCATILMDTTPTRWSDAEKLGYLNDGQKQAVIFKPDVWTVNDEYKLVAGTKQRMPDGSTSYVNAAAATLNEAIQLLEVVRNMGLTGTVAGPAIDRVDLKDMNAINPDWHEATASAEAQSYIYDERYPQHYYVYPPQPVAPGYIEVIYSAVPTAVATTGKAITISDIYELTLQNYILHRCYGKDAALSLYNAGRSVYHWNMFVQSLGRMDLVIKTHSPSINSMRSGQGMEIK